MHTSRTSQSILGPILGGNYKKFLAAGHNNGVKQKVVIDFSSPNIAKPFHFGHLKSTILGNYLVNINEFVGNQVVRLNYIGDWGTQYGLLSLGLDKFKHDLDSDLVTPDQKLRQLLGIYVKANDLAESDQNFYEAARNRLKQLGDSHDSECFRNWNRIRDLSLGELKKSYHALGISFDEYEFESDHARNLDSVIKLLEASQIAHRSPDGMLSARVERKGKFFEVPVLKADGTSLYITRDIAAAIRRKDTYNFDKMLYVVGADQEKHFHCLGNILKNLGHDWHNQLVHVKMGKVLGISSRQGSSILLSDIIEEATRRYIETTRETPTSKVNEPDELEDVGRNLALSALFVYDMRNKRTKNYEFVWDQVMKVTDRSGIHLQTTFARLCSLLERNRDLGREPLRSVEELNSEAISCVEATDLLDRLDGLASAIDSSFDSMSPSYLIDHTFALCRAINRARRSQHLWVIGESNEDRARTRLTLFKAAHIQLELIMRLLGLKPLARV